MFNDPGQVLVFIFISHGNPEEILIPIRNSPELTALGETGETTVAGFSGWQFDAKAKPT